MLIGKKIKFFEFRNTETDILEALGAEINLGGERRRNAVAFWTAPNSTDLEKAKDELIRWARKERDEWNKKKRSWIKLLDE